jgi:hypothetical protein
VEKDYFVDVAKWGSCRFETSAQEFGGWENIEMAVKFSKIGQSLSSFYFRVLPFSKL